MRRGLSVAGRPCPVLLRVSHLLMASFVILEPTCSVRRRHLIGRAYIHKKQPRACHTAVCQQLATRGFTACQSTFSALQQVMSIENKLLSMADGEAPKRSAEDGGSQHYKRARGGSGSDAGRIELRVLIQSKHAGGIIGKGGDTIKRLRVEYSANVGVPDCNGPERILTIKADMDNVIACLIECIPLISEADDPNSGVRILVHQSHAGAIIGRAGYKIKDLRQV